MVDLAGQYQRLRTEIDAALADVLSSAHFIRGPEVDDLQQELQAYLGARHVHGVANGTDALQIAYMALRIGPGDEVITPAFTFIATAEAASITGATPVFADIDPETFNLDPNSVENLITPRTKAIVPVHLFGQAAAMDEILAIGRRHIIPVVEDAAQAIGSRYNRKMLGSLGTIGTLSFFPSKNLGAYGDGGALITNDDELYERMAMIANHGGRHKYYNEVVGMNSRLDAMQAAVLRVKLRHLDADVAARKAAAARYDALLASCTDVVTPACRYDHGFHQYTIRVPERDAVAGSLREWGIPFGIYYPVPLPHLPVFSAPGAARSGPIPHTEQACREVLSLPMHPELTGGQQKRVVEAILQSITR